MLVDIIHSQYPVCRIPCFVPLWIIQVFALLEQYARLLGLEAYVHLCIYTDRMILIVKIKELFISYTRLFLDIFILEDGAHKMSCNVSNTLPIDSAQHPSRSKNSQVSKNCEKTKNSQLINFK